MIETFSASRDLAQRLAVLAGNVFRETYGEAFPSRDVLDRHVSEVFSPRAFEARIESSIELIRVASIAGTLVGYLELFDATPPVQLPAASSMGLWTLYVAVEARGTGVAAMLVDDAVQIARQRRKEMLWVCAWERNARALAFYRKIGFTPVGISLVHAGDVAFRDVVMTRSIC